MKTNFIQIETYDGEFLLNPNHIISIEKHPEYILIVLIDGRVLQADLDKISLFS